MKINQLTLITSLIINIILIISVIGLMQSNNSAQSSDSSNSTNISSSIITMHNHSDKIVNPDSDLIPTINTTITVDPKDGYNIQINTENFVFTPENASTDLNLVNSGHAHLYINDEKVMRLYGDWLNIPSKWLKEPLNKIVIALNTDSHQELHLEGLAINSQFYLVPNALNIDKSSISLEELRYLQSTNPSYEILDVRTKEEFDNGHIENAINISVNDSDFDTQIQSLDKTKTYLIYCKSGNRSKIAFDAMKNNGFNNLYNSKLGFDAWIAKGYPSVK